MIIRKPKKYRSVYLDHAATTPMDPEVFKAMRPFFIENFGNPSALYSLGQIANQAIFQSRRTIAEILRTTPDGIIFTSGGTESDNLAVFGIAYAHKKHGKHIITTPLEHHAVLKPLERLAKDGWKITFVSADKQGIVNPDEVIKAIRPDTVLISVMYANNEIGAIEPIAEIGKRLLRYRKERGTAYPYFHTDACQAAGFLDLDVEKLHVDLMTLNGSKIYGPKGAGLLYARRGVKLQPIIYGGDQERGLRAGTENIPAIVGLAKALQLTNPPSRGARGMFFVKEGLQLQKLTAYFWKKIQEKIPGATLNGPTIGDERLPNNLNIAFPNIEAEKLLFYLNERGIMCATRSACSMGLSEPSHVLKAIGISEKASGESLRFSLGKSTVKEDIDYTLVNLAKLTKELTQ